MNSFLATTHPGHIQPKPAWLQEFQDSAIPLDLAEANATWVQGADLLNLLTENALAQLGGHSQQFMNNYELIEVPVRKSP